MKSFLCLAIIFVTIHSSLQHCPDAKICNIDGAFTEACFNSDTNSLKLNAWNEAKELFSLVISDVTEDSFLLHDCPEIIQARNVILRYTNKDFQLDKVEIDEDELDLVMLSYTSLLHKSKFDKSLEVMRAKRQELLNEINQFKSRF